jgi:superfamily II DNA helicase RecQ
MSENETISSGLDVQMAEARQNEISAREKVVASLRQIHEQKIWKELGYRSLREFCEKELGYDTFETKEVLIACGLIITRYQMIDPDPTVQKRIDDLRRWRTDMTALHATRAYLILSNRAIMALAKADPKNKTDLVSVYGIGPNKVMRFGDDILRCLGHGPLQ